MLNEIFAFEKLISKTKRKKNWNDDTVLTSAKFILMAYNGFRLARSSAAFISEKKNQNQNMLNILIRRKQLANDIVRWICAASVMFIWNNQFGSVHVANINNNGWEIHLEFVELNFWMSSRSVGNNFNGIPRML